MRRIRATAEVKALKTVIYERTMEVIILRNENDELRKQLAESRAKEGKGCLERIMENLTKTFASLDFYKMLESNPELFWSCDSHIASLEVDDEEDDNNAI